MAWKLSIYFSDVTEELVDEDFETEDAAQAEYESWLEGWGAGREVLKLSNEDYSDADIIDHDIWEE